MSRGPSTQGERLRQAIELAGFRKVAPFAESIGESPIKVRQHINRDSIPTDAVEKYVRRLAHVGVTTDWLMFNRGKPPKGLPALKPMRLGDDERPNGATIEITHMVGAGDEIYPVPGDGPIGHVTAPTGYENGGAMGIRGDSMLPAYHDQDLLFYKGWEDPPTPRRITDRAMAIELADGRSFLKKLLEGNKPDRFHLLSINPAAPIVRNVRVVRVARIGWVWVGGLAEADAS